MYKAIVVEYQNKILLEENLHNTFSEYKNINSIGYYVSIQYLKTSISKITQRVNHRVTAIILF